MNITTQDLMIWFMNLCEEANKQKIPTQAVNESSLDVSDDEKKVLLILDILQKYDKEITAIPTETQWKTFRDIVQECRANSFVVINVATKKRSEAIIAIHKYIDVNF